MKNVARGFIGAEKNNPSNYFIKHGFYELSSRCNFTDLCNDADALGLVHILKDKLKESHALSEQLNLNF